MDFNESKSMVLYPMDFDEDNEEIAKFFVIHTCGVNPIFEIPSELLHSQPA